MRNGNAILTLTDIGLKVGVEIEANTLSKYHCGVSKQNDAKMNAKTKKDDGPVRIQLVILPLSKKRGFRCSVKPASPSTLYFRNHEAQSLHSTPLAQLSTWNGQARESNDYL
ncbi:hypothetical protein ES332_D03G183300v1 [Gossypium tomentosum]|uniref:Uncharacterized protein n=1 Tax=Gossypium tomentosum TaxID=34277 RepID=A0A5D2LPN1_GOSTO|nr:hypothetical protein ES332_D03G183300v1 [Gossypium tomentosum]